MLSYSLWLNHGHYVRIFLGGEVHFWIDVVVKSVRYNFDIRLASIKIHFDRNFFHHKTSESKCLLSIGRDVKREY